MMELKLIDHTGESTARIAAPDEVFGRAYNEALIHQVVTAYLANGRSGTRMQKDRGEVKHSTKKPWRQKGTGRARAGMTSSPLWRGGGRIFPNRPDENFSHKLNKKMYRAGVCSILSQLAREGRLVVVDSFTLDAPKTKLLAQKVKGMGLENVLIITDAIDENLLLSSRNLPNVDVVAVSHADPVSLIGHATVMLTKSAIAKFEELLK
jgi:large subunit ribosomal protein L4